MLEGAGFRKALIGLLFTLLAVIVFGLVWFFVGAGAASPVGFGWYLFSFAAGLSMIVLPCTLPLAFIIVPLSMGKGVGKGFAIAIAFGLGVAITLSMYGILAAAIGKVAIGSLGAPLELVKNWLYFIAGLFAYLFALGELGLVNFRMPSYSGAFPPFIQKQKDILKALLLGLFLGNIGVGCPHPATPVILTRIAVSGDIFYGWLLFFVHAIGRILPLIFLAILGILGVNALQGLVKHKEKIQRATGWAMVFVAAFILVLGLFTHDWWVVSGQHTFLEGLTQEERFVEVIAGRLKVAVPHEHGLPPADHTGLFGLPLQGGTWVLLFLWILPFFWYYIKKKKEITAITDSPVASAEARAEAEVSKKTLPYLFWNFVTLSLILILVFGYILPSRFLAQAHPSTSSGQAARMEEEMMPHEEGMTGAMENMDQHMEGMMGGAHGAQAYHEADEISQGLTIEFKAIPESDETAELRTGVPVRMEFLVVEKPANTPVADLEIEHEKYMHVIGIRDDLNEFFHIHPVPVFEEDGKTPVPGLWSVSRTFFKPGTYKIWADITRGGVTHSLGFRPFRVGGAGPVSEKQIISGTNVIVDKYQVNIEYDAPIPVGHKHDLSFDVHDLFGNEVEVEPYLAADMHLAVIKDDLQHYLHTHPEGGNHHARLPQINDIASRYIVREASAHGKADTPGAVMGGGSSDEHINFHITFPEPGIYKLFAQFRPKGTDLPPDEALTASFYVKAEEAQAVATGLPVWWRNLIVSVILIALLSWGVKRYLSVNPKTQAPNSK